MIKFLDLKKINSTYKAKLELKASKIIRSGQYIFGKEVESFEKNFANFCGTKFCVGVASGLDALTLVLLIEMGKLKKGITLFLRIHISPPFWQLLITVLSPF